MKNGPVCNEANRAVKNLKTEKKIVEIDNAEHITRQRRGERDSATTLAVVLTARVAKCHGPFVLKLPRHLTPLHPPPPAVT